jgi:cobalamin biosynthesis Mg chelatase CobN
LIRQRVKKAAAVVLAPALALFACATASAQSETLYVIEQLVVSVSATSDGSGDRVTQIKSGDRVELLERQGDQAHVKLSSGEEGWVRSSYLSPAPPMREQLKARTDELEKLKQEKSKLEADLATARKAASSAAAAAASAPAPATATTTARGAGANAAGSVAGAGTGTGTGDPGLSQSVADDSPAGDPAAGGPDSGDAAPADLPSSNPPLFSDEGMMPSRPTWIVALIAAAIALGVGFALGWRMLDRRIRAKYGGLRIY